MSVHNETIESLTVRQHSTAVTINNDNYTVKSMAQRETLLNRYRPYLLSSVMCVVVAFYIVDYYRSANIALPAAPEKPEIVSIDTVLVDKDVNVVTLFPAVGEDNNTPQSVLEFIGGNLPVSNPVKKQVVLYELVPERTPEVIDVNKLLSRAKALLERDRLTSPKDNSAFSHYRKVLSTYPDNKEALAGMQKIVDRYLYFADKVIEKGEEYKLPELIRNAYFVGESYMDMEPLLKRFAHYIANNANSFDGAVVERKTVDQVPVASMQIKPSIKYVDVETSRIASGLLVSGDVIGAKIILENFAAISEYWGESYDRLLQIYLNEGSVDKAEKLIYRNTTLSAYQLAEKAARIFVARNDLAGALDLLQGHEPGVDGNENYYALMAGLLHKHGSYDKAVVIYRRLLAMNHKNSRYWLGLAVSLDSMLDEKAALTAFKYADQYASDNSSVKQYIEQRIVSLSN